MHLRDMEDKVPVQSFRDLRVWQKAHELTLLVYKETQCFPKEEMYGLTSQIRRAAASTSANIAEGWKRKYRNDRSHFLNMAEGSNEEVRYFIILSRDLTFLGEASSETALILADQIGAMLYSLIRSLKSAY